MACPACGASMVAFDVPDVAREAAPGDPAAICPDCLTLAAAEASHGGTPPDFSRLVKGFPDGEAGAITAVAVGLLVESVALHREAVADLMDAAQDVGADPWLVIERLAATPTVQPDADLERAREQLEQLLE